MPSTLNLTGALRYALGRIGTRNGIMLMAAYVAVQLVTQVTTQSMAARVMDGRLPTEATGELYPLAVDLPLATSGGLTAFLVLAGTVLGVLTMRAFYRDLEAFPTAEHTRRLGRTVLVTLVVSVVVFVAIAVGTVFLILPGIFLAVSLVFAVLVVVVEDASVIEALRRSWSLTKGNRIRLFVLGFLLVVLGGIVGAAFSLVGMVAPVVGEVGGAVGSGVVGAFGVALLVGAYRQLADGDAIGAAGASTPAL